MGPDPSIPELEFEGSVGPGSRPRSLMHLIEIFLPLTDNQDRAFDAGLFATVRRELTDRFGGMTAFSRSPAQGITEEGGKKVQDDIVVMEVMAESLDRDWWSSYRAQLEKRFRQDEILIRASEVSKL